MVTFVQSRNAIGYRQKISYGFLWFYTEFQLRKIQFLTENMWYVCRQVYHTTDV